MCVWHHLSYAATINRETIMIIQTETKMKVQLLTAQAVVLVSGFRLPPHVSPYGYYAKQGFIPVVPPVEMMDLYKVPFYLK